MTTTTVLPRLAAARAIFQALFDGAEVGDDWDEGRWVHFMQVVNEAGRFVFGYPHLVSSESDIFGALDDIASELEQTKGAIVQTGTEARKALYELHQALEPLLPADDERPGIIQPHSAGNNPAPDSADEASERDAEGFTPPQARLVAALRAAAPDPDTAADAIDRVLGHDRVTEAEVRQANPSPALDVPAAVEALSRVGRASESAVVVPSAVAKADVECEGCHKPFKAGLGIATHRRSCSKLHPGEIVLITPAVLEKASKVQPQTPSEEDERYFEAIRRLGNDASYADVARDTKAKAGRIHQRFDLLASYYTLPADIAVWRAHRSTQKGGVATVGVAQKRIEAFKASESDIVREVAADIKARELATVEGGPAVDEFLERRRAAASARAAASWDQRTRPADA